VNTTSLIKPVSIKTGLQKYQTFTNERIKEIMNPLKNLLFTAIAIVLLACDVDEPEIGMIDPQPQMNVGYRPVYGSRDYAEISWNAPQSIKSPGKIYVYGKYLLVNETREGIHVYDNSNPQSPAAIGFIRILGNTDMAIKDGVLYADHMGNLIALTLNDFSSVQEKGRLDLSQWDLGLPPPAGSNFECVDPSKGLVINWKKTDAQNLKCYALR
jgi:hypothetical protein